MSVRMALAKLSAAAAGTALAAGGAVHVAEPQTATVSYKSDEDSAAGPNLIDIKDDGSARRHIPRRETRRIRRVVELEPEMVAEPELLALPALPLPMPEGQRIGGGGGGQPIIIGGSGGFGGGFGGGFFGGFFGGSGGGGGGNASIDLSTTTTTSGGGTSGARPGISRDTATFVKPSPSLA